MYQYFLLHTNFSSCNYTKQPPAAAIRNIRSISDHLFILSCCNHVWSSNKNFKLQRLSVGRFNHETNIYLSSWGIHTKLSSFASGSTETIPGIGLKYDAAGLLINNEGSVAVSIMNHYLVGFAMRFAIQSC